MKALKFFGKLVEYLVFIALVAILFVVASPLLPTKTFIATYVVSSGSMEPAIPTGSIVFSRPVDALSLAEKDIITFTDPNDPKKTIVHRIVSIKDEGGVRTFMTKGDNNNAQDNWTVTSSLIKGKSISSVPLLGLGVNYLKTPKGFLIGIGIPALILVLLELKKIKEGIDDEVKRRTQKEVERLKNTEILIAAFLLVSFFAIAKPVQAFFSAQATLTGITLAVADFNRIDPGNVVINEIMWMGSTADTADQWLELKNTSDAEINLSGCTLNGVEAGNNSSLVFGPETTIAPNGYFLIVKKDPGKTALADDVNVDLAIPQLKFHNDYDKNGRITLVCNDIVIDEATDPTGTNWPKGIFEPGYGLHQSMERNDDPATGWHTCTSDGCTSADFWKEPGNDYGTPGAANLPEIDQSDMTFLTLSLTNQNHAAHFELKGLGLKRFTQASYTLTYLGDNIPQPLVGSMELTQDTPVYSKDVDLGTCSDEVCVYPEKVSEVKLKILLHGTEIDRTLTDSMPN